MISQKSNFTQNSAIFFGLKKMSLLWVSTVILIVTMAIITQKNFWLGTGIRRYLMFIINYLFRRYSKDENMFCNFEGCSFPMVVFISLFSSAQDGRSFHHHLPREFYSPEYLLLFPNCHWRLLHQSRSKFFVSKNFFKVFQNLRLSTSCVIDIMSVLTSILPFHVRKVPVEFLSPVRICWFNLCKNFLPKFSLFFGSMKDTTIWYKELFCSN